MKIVKYIEKSVAKAADEGFKQEPLRLSLIDESCIDYISETEFWGNRTYWHGSHSPKSEADPSIINKLKPETNYEET